MAADVDQPAARRQRRCRVQRLSCRLEGGAKRGHGQEGEHGVQQPRRVRLRNCLRARRNIHTTSARSAGGHTQPRVCNAAAPGAKTSRAVPTRPMSPAGTAAQRCGWSVQRAEPTASRAQPRANASIAVPVMTCSSAPAKATSVNTAAVTSPATSETATTGPTRRLRAGVTVAMPKIGAASFKDFDVVISGSFVRGFGYRLTLAARPLRRNEAGSRLACGWPHVSAEPARTAGRRPRRAPAGESRRRQGAAASGRCS